MLVSNILGQKSKFWFNDEHVLGKGSAEPLSRAEPFPSGGSVRLGSLKIPVRSYTDNISTAF